MNYEELKETRNILDNVIQAIIGVTRAKENVNEIESKLVPGVYEDLDRDLEILENLKISLENKIDKLKEVQEYSKNNPQWREERKQQEREYWSTQF